MNELLSRYHRKKTSIVPHVLISGFTLIAAIGIIWYRTSTPIRLGPAQNQVQAKAQKAIPVTTKTSRPEVSSATWKMGFRTKSFNSQASYDFVAMVANHTTAPIDELFIYVRSKHPTRTVPERDELQIVRIPGGIEPNEVKPVEFSISRRDTETDPPQPFEVGIVDRIETDRLYEKFKGASMVLAIDNTQPGKFPN